MHWCAYAWMWSDECTSTWATYWKGGAYTKGAVLGQTRTRGCRAHASRDFYLLSRARRTRRVHFHKLHCSPYNPKVVCDSKPKPTSQNPADCCLNNLACCSEVNDTRLKSQNREIFFFLINFICREEFWNGYAYKRYWRNTPTLPSIFFENHKFQDKRMRKSILWIY